MALFKKGEASLPLKRIKFDLGNETYINIRELAAQELIDFQKRHGEKEINNADFLYSLVATCACDDNGQPLFTDVEDVKANFGIGISTLVEIQEAIFKVSGINAAKN